MGHTPFECVHFNEISIECDVWPSTCSSFNITILSCPNTYCSIVLFITCWEPFIDETLAPKEHKLLYLSDFNMRGQTAAVNTHLPAE